MENGPKRIDSSFVKAFESFLNLCAPLLLIYGILLFDSLEIMVYGKGILDTDFSGFLNLSAIPFFLLFLAAFGVVATSLSSLANGILYRLFVWLSSKFELFFRKLFKFELKQKINENSASISSLYEIALVTENAFLLEYINKEIKSINNARKNHRIAYSLSIAIIINWLATLLYNKKTIIDFIISLYKNDGLSFITACLTLLLIPVAVTILFGLKHSIVDDTKIYFPDAKYSLLVEEKKSFLMKK